MRVIRGLVRACDLTSYWTSRTASWIVLAIIFAIAYEVVTRYFFRYANFWAYDTAWYLGATFIVLGGCYVTLVSGHVRIDVLSTRFPRKLRLWIEVIFIVIFFMPLWSILTKKGWELFHRAVEKGEVSELTYWWPPLWPVRLTVALGLTLLLIAGVSWLIKTIYELRTGKELRSGLEVD